MLQIWFKIEEKEKIVKSQIFSLNDRINEENFADLISKACEVFDVPTPVILKPHFQNYLNFNHCVFLPRDFVETFGFDKLILENAAD